LWPGTGEKERRSATKKKKKRPGRSVGLEPSEGPGHKTKKALSIKKMEDHQQSLSGLKKKRTSTEDKEGYREKK